MNRRGFLALLLAGGAAACQGGPPASRLPRLTFNHLTPLRLGVGTLAVEAGDAGAPDMPEKARNVGFLAPVAPADAAARWARARLNAAGGDAEATFTVTTAGVFVRRLTPKEGVEGFFTDEPGERYTAVLAGRLHITGPRARGTVTARAEHSKEVAESATLNERERAQFDLVEDLLADFDAEMVQQIKKHLDRWLAV